MSFKLQNPDKFRENIRKKIALKLTETELLQKIADAHSIDTEIVSTNMEKGIFNYAVRECNFKKLVKKWENPALTQIYIDRLRMVFNNLSSQTVVDGLISGDILPQAVAFMTHQEFNPKHWADNIQRKMKRDASKYNAKIEASTDMFTCRRCKSTRCTYYELQTRSADESATVFITCLECGKHWKS
jgi:DNA-directed RNA polymerase subunit M/transcription elongation factor TFIIS